MKKAITITILLCLFGMASEVIAQKNRTLSNGFSFKVELGFPSASYGWDDKVDSDYEYETLIGFQLGNQWYFNQKEKYGIGLMVNWIDFSMTRKMTTGPYGTFARATVAFGFLEIGPVGTYVLSENMALDAYYNLRPTSMATAYANEGDDPVSYGGLSFTHAIGAGFRYDALFLGMEYEFGKVEISQSSTGEEFYGETKINANNFRFLVGVKF